ncbi:hypothetical protein LEP1GSC021_2221 [Leptospira noguchii str. 1993005606]|nr:hypothetical protein LEP1GSC021_2221 [Leptospira noguchii str. 1993005606]
MQTILFALFAILTLFQGRLTNLDAIQKLQWYALCWKIEVFHKILKSGCKVKESKLRTAESW